MRLNVGAQVRKILFAVVLALIAALIHFAPASLRADVTPELPLRGMTRRIFMLCGGLTTAWAALLFLFNPAAIDARRIKSWIIACGFISGVVILFVLPPFQGPDENAHWYTAVRYCRSNAQEREPALYYLPKAFKAESIPFHADRKFDPRGFQEKPLMGAVSNNGLVSYANCLTYPFVIAVSVFFPRVETTQEGLLFYYLCRFLPLVCFFKLQLYLNRRFELPYIAFCFFSFPLVLQQFTVVSADTVVNFGVFAVVLLYERLSRKVDILGFGALAFVCAAIAVNKPIVWGLFATLLVFIPYSKIPHKALVIPCSALIALSVFCAVVRHIGAVLVATRINDDVIFQANLISTMNGFKEFLRASSQNMHEWVHLHAWTGPLGWLDAELSYHHRFLLKCSFGICLILDVIYILIRIAEVRTKAKELIIAAAVALFHLFMLIFSMFAILFVGATPPNLHMIAGMQIRYIYPAIIFMLVLPMIALSRDELHPDTSTALCAWRSRTALGLNALAAGFLPVLLFAQAIEAFVMLTIRYW